MGLNFYTAREILRCRDASGRIGDVATIGRLQHFLLPNQSAQLKALGLPDGRWANTAFGAFADDFFSAAGARTLVSIDASAYESASILHDMNDPIGSELHERFDLVVDGGSIEHIFRPQDALANSMKMTSTGGHLIVWAPANNQCGHGFYQFSPEFFFRALQAQSGFEIRRVLLVECVYPSVSLTPPRRAYEVSDPNDVRERVGALSHRPLMLLVHAVKTAHLPDPFVVTPQQSDYVLQWSENASPRTSLLDIVKRTRGGLFLRNHAVGLLERRRFSLRNRRFFTLDV